jgi:hypothetical protein
MGKLGRGTGRAIGNRTEQNVMYAPLARWFSDLLFIECPLVMRVAYAGR